MKKKLLGLQYLRAVAALGVVAFHAGPRVGYWFYVGEGGVDLFFILSGFLMVAITGPDTRPASFLIDRFRRIAPSYWIATTVVLIGALMGLFPNMRLAWWHVIASYAFIPAASPTGGRTWPLLVPGWTLNYEMIFYLFFAITMRFASSQRKQVVAMTLIFSALVVGGFVLQPKWAILRFYTDPILLEFVAGAWLGVLWKRDYWTSRLSWPAIWVSVTAFVVIGVINTAEMRVVLFGIPALILVAGVLGLERDNRVGRAPILLLFGDASYSIYLWHDLAISVMLKAAEKLHWPEPVALCASIFGGVAIGIAAFRLIETPFLRYFRERRFVHGIPVPSGP